MRRNLIGTIALGLIVSVSTTSQAQQSPGDSIHAILIQYDINTKQCWTMHAHKQLRTYKDAWVCADTGIVGSLQAAGYPYMDLIELMVAQHRVIAERADTKKITGIEVLAQNAQMMSGIDAEIKRRNFAARRETEEAYARAQAQSDAQARAQAAADAQARALEQMQAQASAEAEAERRAALARFGAGLLAPTVTGSFGESLGNALGAY